MLKRRKLKKLAEEIEMLGMAARINARLPSGKALDPGPRLWEDMAAAAAAAGQAGFAAQARELLLEAKSKPPADMRGHPWDSVLDAGLAQLPAGSGTGDR